MTQEGREPREVTDALIAILSNFFWLLVILIGENLGLRKVHEIWPDVPLTAHGSSPREPLTALLEGHGADVSAASCAGEALALLDARTPDLIIADIGLPGEDGYAFIRRVRARHDSGADKVPALALTAYASPEDRGRALASGYQMPIAKPVEPHRFMEAVASLAWQARVRNSSDAARKMSRE